MTSATAETPGLRNGSSAVAAASGGGGGGGDGGVPSSAVVIRHTRSSIPYSCYSCSATFNTIPTSAASTASAAAPCPQCFQRNIIPRRIFSPPSPSLPVPNSGYSSGSSVSYMSSDDSDSDDDDYDSDDDYESDSGKPDLNSFVASLPVKIFAPNSTPPHPSCSICMEDFGINPDASRTVHELPCGHYFHKDCIVQWLHRRRTCPLCRCRVRINTAGAQGIDREAHLVVDIITTSTEPALIGVNGEESTGSTAAASSSFDTRVLSTNDGAASAMDPRAVADEDVDALSANP